MHLNKQFGIIYFNLGWFRGDPFVLFQIKIGEIIEGLHKVGTLILLDIQVARFSLGFGLNFDR